MLRLYICRQKKAGVRAAIIDQVNRGTLVLNYTGHGNPTVWAHESILTLDDVKTQFFNADKLTFAVAATCDWGRFDEPGAQSSAEEMISNERGGGIGVFSALRPVYDGDNAELNQNLYDQLLPKMSRLFLHDWEMLSFLQKTKQGTRSTNVNIIFSAILRCDWGFRDDGLH